MQEIDPDEYCAMLEEEARINNPEEEYKMDAAYLIGTFREKIDELEKFIDDLIDRIKLQNSGQTHKNKHNIASSRPNNGLRNCKGERESQKNKKITPVEEASQKVHKVKEALLNLESELRSFRC